MWLKKIKELIKSVKIIVWLQGFDQAHFERKVIF